MNRPKLNFPYENGFIQLNPSLAAEIGRDPAIVFMYFVFMLEGNTKYLLWDIETQSYWVRKSYNRITYDLFPYFKIKYFRDGRTEDITFAGVHSKMRGILSVLSDKNKINILNRKLIKPSTDYYYSINYEMCSLLNGISVRWDFDPDHNRREVITKKEDIKQLSLDLAVSGGHTKNTVLCQNEKTQQNAMSNEPSAMLTVTPYIYNRKKNNIKNIKRESPPEKKFEIPREVRELVDEAFN